MVHYQAKTVSKVFKIAMVLLLVSFCSLAYSQTRDRVDKLIQQLRDEDVEVRWRAVEALVKIGKPAVEPLIAALEDEGSGVRMNAAEALGEIGDSRAVELIAALGVENIAAWSYRATSPMSAIKSANSNLVWQTLGKAYRRL